VAGGTGRGAAHHEEQDVPEHSDDDDVLVELTKDHDEMRQMFTVLRGGVQGEDQEETVRRLTVEVVKHAVAEETHLYPLMRKVLPGGNDITEHEIEEHAQVEELLKKLEKLDPTDAEYRPTLDKVMDDLDHHARDEETNVFPELRSTLPQSDLVELGHKVRRTKKLAPTHPHPAAPDTPPWNKLAGPMAGLVDRARDAFSNLKS
jgi:hemerythrin superfamily protein